MKDFGFLFQKIPEAKKMLKYSVLLWGVFFSIGFVTIGSAALLKDVIHITDLVFHTLPNIQLQALLWFFNLLLLSFMTIFCYLSATLNGRYKYHYISIALLSNLFLLSSIGILSSAQINNEYYNTLSQVWLIFTFACMTFFSGIWTGYWNTLGRDAKNGFIGLIALTLLKVVVTTDLPTDNVDLILIICLLLLLAPAVWWQGSFLLERPAQRFWEFICFLGCLLSFFIFSYITFDAGEICPSWLNVMANLSYIPLLTFSTFMLQTNRAELIKRPNIEFEKELRLKAEQLRIANQALRVATEKRVLLEERERLTRDVHDGIGGKLLSLLVRVRSRDIEKEIIQNELEDCLSDLRLIVDSLDTSQESFIATLATFHTRARAQLSAVNIRLDWSQTDVTLQNIPFDVQTTLNVNRFMQEVVTNSIRHSQASAMSINVSRKHDQADLNIVMRDNGIGIPDIMTAQQAGRGLKNLHKRAQMLGANFTATNNSPETGAEFIIIIPIPES